MVPPGPEAGGPVSLAMERMAVVPDWTVMSIVSFAFAELLSVTVRVAV